MTLETFFEKFELFADAPDAVAKMRGFVLRLAMQGKLSEPRNDDGAVSHLLREVENDKEKLGIKGSGSAADEVIEEESFDDIPSRWTWVRFGNIARHNAGKTLDKGRNQGELRDYITTSNLYWGFFQLDEKRQMPIQDEELDRCTATKGDLLIVEGGEAGRAAVWPHDYEICFQNHIHRARLFARINPYFVQRYFEKLNATGEIAKFRKGVGISNMSGKALASIPIPLPPLAEQKRIVAKVDELMALCDRLEAQQQERETRHAALARASLARFAEAPTPANLDWIFNSSFSIPPSDLRKSILTLAVQGKLVLQDPNDEPAWKLIARIERERATIAEEQGVRPPKNVPPLTDADHPHDIPESWQWARIGHLSLVIDYGTSQKADNDSSKVPVYRMGNIASGRLVDESLKYVDASIDDLPGLYLKSNDILFNRTNSYELVGKAGIYTGANDTATFASYLIRIRLPSALLFPAFFNLAMNAPYFRQTQIEPQVVQQCGQANFNGTKLSSTVVPVPPFAEQRRIVAKVDALMALVDALETQLATARATAANLLAAAVAEHTQAKESHAPAEV